MRIAILTSGVLPVPAVQGGAVENFLDFFLEYNDQQKLHDITVYSVETIASKTSSKLVYNLYNDKLNYQTRNSQLIYDAATLIISTSNYITNRVKTINDYTNKCITIYSGIELQKFNRELTPRVKREDINLTSDDFVMLFSGRITQEKGIMELIEAMNMLEDYPHIKLLVIGSSFYGNADNENDFAKSLKKKAEPLKDRIIFTGFIPYSDMPNYLNIADVSVIPSVWDDPFPTTVLEAQAMGLPIITTRRGGIPEEVTEDNAILLDTDELFIDNLAKAILDLYEHPEKRRAMSEAALKRSKLFSKERYAREFFEALESTT